MASKACLRHLRQLAGLSPQPDFVRNGAQTCIASSRRAMATVSDATESAHTATVDLSSDAADTSKVLTTVYTFPDMEPKRFAYFPHNHLYLPLRKDILHKAVVFEGDATRQGTASTKWRDDVHGTHKKVHPQKGLGKARVGDKQSPIRRGGGVAFGPKPRDFSSKLNRKVYDLAWRTALSYRYRRGELVIVDEIRNLDIRGPSWIKKVFASNGWGRENRRSLLVTERQTSENEELFESMQLAGDQGRLLTLDDVDVKNLLETGRVVIEHRALKRMLRDHRSDLVPMIQPVASPSVEQDLTA